jgi:hypothetical protein
MGDELKKPLRRGTRLATGLEVGEKLGKVIEKPFRTGASAAARKAEQETKKMQQKEGARLAEAESEVATARALAKSGKGGRKSLIKTSPGGLAVNLGGTA